MVGFTDNSNFVMEVTFDVEGMVCMSCVKSIKAALSEKAGIVNNKVSLERSQAWIRFNNKKVSMEEIRLTIEDCGFDVVVSGDLSVTLLVCTPSKGLLFCTNVIMFLILHVVLI